MKRKKNKAVSFFAACMAILLVCSTLIWGFQTSWGSVKIKRLNLSQSGWNNREFPDLHTQKRNR